MQNAAPRMRETRLEVKGSHPDSDTSHLTTNLRGNTTRVSRGVGATTQALTGGQTRKTQDHLRDDESVQSSDHLSANKTGSLVSKNVPKTVTITEKTKIFEESLKNENKHLILSEDENKLMNSDCFNRNLTYVERILNQGQYHKQYIQYRNYPEVKDKQEKGDDKDKYKAAFLKRPKVEEKAAEEEENKEKDNILSLLFKFKCDLTAGRTVSNADWNHVNPDL